MNNSLDIRLFKYLSWVLLMLALACIGIYIYAEIVGDNLALPWQESTSYFPKPLFIEYFNINSVPIGFNLDQYIAWRQYNIGDMQFLAWPSWLVLGALLICLWIVTTAITYFSRFWYLITTGAIIILTLQMNLAELQFWGDYGLYLALGIIILATYFFHAIRPETTLSIRLLGMAACLGVYILLASFFGQTNEMGLTFTSYGLIAPLILSGLFMVFVAGENIYSILKVSTTKGGKAKNNLIHFIVLGLVYNIIMILFFMNRRDLIDFEMSFISPYVVLIISSISAFFSFDLRFEKQKGILPISILKQWVFPVMFAVTFVTISYASLTANDPLTEALEYGIIISHLAVGTVYFVSAIINFTPLIIENLNVAKVFYKPQMAPMFLINIGSALFVVALLFYVNFYPFRQMRAGTYNALGDLSEKKNQTLLAEQYYKQGVAEDYINFKSNFQVAKYEKTAKNAANTLQSFDNTFFKNASGKGYTALGSYYNSKDQIFNTLFTLKEAKKTINSKQINNNLALTYRQFNAYDSAYLLLLENWNTKEDELTKVNLLALSTELPRLGSADSLIQTLSSKSVHSRVNALALANSNNLSKRFLPKKNIDTLLFQDDLFLLFNASLNLPASNDSTLIDLIDYYLENPYNNALRSFLYQAKAIQLYQLGRINQAFLALELLKTIDNGNSAQYNFMSGIWALHQNQRLLSNDYFEQAISQGYKPSEIESIQNVVLGIEIPSYENPIKPNLTTSLSQLEVIARANSFDEQITLQAIEQMKTANASDQQVYQILLEAHQINKYSIPIGQAYVLAAVNSGLSQYANDGLVELSMLMPAEAYKNFEVFVNQKIKERRDQFN